MRLSLCLRRRAITFANRYHCTDILDDLLASEEGKAASIDVEELSAYAGLALRCQEGPCSSGCD